MSKVHCLAYLVLRCILKLQKASIDFYDIHKMCFLNICSCICSFQTVSKLLGKTEFLANYANSFDLVNANNDIVSQATSNKDLLEPDGQVSGHTIYEIQER